MPLPVRLKEFATGALPNVAVFVVLPKVTGASTSAIVSADRLSEPKDGIVAFVPNENSATDAAGALFASLGVLPKLKVPAFATGASALGMPKEKALSEGFEAPNENGASEEAVPFFETPNENGASEVAVPALGAPNENGAGALELLVAVFKVLKENGASDDCAAGFEAPNEKGVSAAVSEVAKLKGAWLVASDVPNLKETSEDAAASFAVPKVNNAAAGAVEVAGSTFIFSGLFAVPKENDTSAVVAGAAICAAPKVNAAFPVLAAGLKVIGDTAGLSPIVAPNVIGDGATFSCAPKLNGVEAAPNVKGEEAGLWGTSSAFC